MLCWIGKLHGPEGLTILVNSRLLAVACHTDHTVRLFSLDNGEEVARMTGGNGSEHQGDREPLVIKFGLPACELAGERDQTPPRE